MRSLLLISILVCVGFPCLLAGEQVTGVVSDPDGRPIAGVNISVDGVRAEQMTDADGAFDVTIDLSKARYLTFSHVSYQPLMVKVTRSEPLKVVMELTTYPMQGIAVSADRAELGKSPIAFSDFTAREIKRDYLLGEFPLLLKTTPNVYAYADAGAGLGYSYLKIRGFDDKRVSVYINGIPLNDPEDQATYFVDLPDFAANVKDIQVQRGIGNSQYADASFGGSVNIVSGVLEQQRQVTLTSGYGSFWHGGDLIGDMRKQTIEYRSGLIDGKWSLAGRYSRQLSDGYRKDSWYDGWSYYLSLSRLDPKMSTTLNLYGGPMKMHLAYYGASREQLSQDRRYNPLTYANETDNFSQPHYELHNSIKLSESMSLDNTLYYIHGNGYYEQYKEGQKFAKYGIPPTNVVTPAGDTVRITKGDLVRRRWVTKDQLGWNPRLEIAQRRGTLSLGGSFYYFDAEHWGEVVWAEKVTKIDPQHRYYEHFGTKLLASLYAAQNYRLSDHLKLMANLQLRHQIYDFDQTKMGVYQGYEYDVNWTALSPRIGLTYSLTDQTSFLLNYSFSSRTPTDEELYKASDPAEFPSLTVSEVRHNSADDSTIIFGDPLVKPERVHDFELGMNYRSGKQSAGVNLYWMEFRNEIVRYGRVDPDLGVALSSNVDRSVHAGIELAAARSLGDRFKLSGNFSYSYNRIKKHQVNEDIYDNYQNWEWVDNQLFNYDGKITPGFPAYIGNIIAEYSDDVVDLTYYARFLGRQYVENSNRHDLSIPPYVVSSVAAAFSAGRWVRLADLRLSLRVDNVFNKKYEASGAGVGRFRDIGDEYRAEYIPAAERSFFASLGLEFR